MRGRILWAALLFAPMAQAQDDWRASDAHRLVDQLGSYDRYEREEAARRLRAMGERALPALEQGARSYDSGVRRMSVILIRDIEDESRFERSRWDRPAWERRRTPMRTGMGSGAAQELERLGLLTRAADETLQRHLDLRDEGLVILRVERGSPADRIGLREDDVIVSADGSPVHEPHDLVQVFERTRPRGNTINLVVLREGSVHHLTCDPEHLRAAGGADVVEQQLGARIIEVDPQLRRRLALDTREGIVIQDVQPGGFAARLGLERNDVVVRVDGRRVQEPSDLSEVLRAGTRTFDEPVEIVVIRDGRMERLRMQQAGEPTWGANLGLETTQMDARVQTAEGIVRGGLFVTAVQRDGLAERLGLQEHDLILEVNGVEVQTRGDFEGAVQRAGRFGDPLSVVIVRNGERRTLRMGGEPLPFEGGAFRRSEGTFGAAFEPVDPVLEAQLGIDRGGIVVRDVDAGSQAERMGLQPYDVIVSIDGNVVSRSDEVATFLRASGGRPVRCVLYRNGQRRTIELSPDAYR